MVVELNGRKEKRTPSQWATKKQQKGERGKKRRERRKSISTRTELNHSEGPSTPHKLQMVRGKSPAQQEKSVSWGRKKRENGKRKPKRASQTKAIANSGANSYDPGQGTWGPKSCDTIKPWPFLRRCAYSSTRPRKLNFTIELPRSADARLDTRQCRIKRPRTRAKKTRAAQKRSFRGGAVSLETSNVGRRAWVCEMIHEKASCSSTGKRNNAVGGSKKWL